MEELGKGCGWGCAILIVAVMIILSFVIAEFWAHATG